MQMIAVEQFISAVRQRPALWDSQSDDYKDRVLKKDGWVEVCQIVCPTFADKFEEERNQIVRDMQLKWKNLRDAYVRHIRMRMDRLQTSKPVKSYIYHHQMAFLRGVINPRIRSRRPQFGSTPEDRVKKEDDEEEEEEEAELTKEDLVEMVEYDVKSGNFDDEDNDSETSVDPLLSEMSEKEVYDNDDMNFFKSLLPCLQTLSTEQKLKFRIDVMELLMTYHQSTST